MPDIDRKIGQWRTGRVNINKRDFEFQQDPIGILGQSAETLANVATFNPGDCQHIQPLPRQRIAAIRRKRASGFLR